MNGSQFDFVTMELDLRVVRCNWCVPRIGRARFFANGAEVPAPADAGLLSDTICAECLEAERTRLERMHQAA